MSAPPYCQACYLPTSCKNDHFKIHQASRRLTIGPNEEFRTRRRLRDAVPRIHALDGTKRAVTLERTTRVGINVAEVLEEQWVSRGPLSRRVSKHSIGGSRITHNVHESKRVVRE